MNKISIAVLALAFFAGAPLLADAAPRCNSNATPDLQIGDPACYTSRTTTWSERYTYTEYETRTTRRYCRWRCGYPLYICGSGGRQWFSTRGGRGCGQYSSICYNNCGGNACHNGSPRDYWGYTRVRVPVTRTGYRTRSGTAYTCYYTTVSSWGTCDANAGVQSAASVRQHAASGTNCQNRSEATTRTCAACGTAAGVGSGIMPALNLCAPTNTASAVTLNGNQWEWTCTAASGSVNCTAPNEVDGRCSAAHDDQLILPADAPLPADNTLCDAGVYQVGSLAGNPNGPWTWTCDPIGPRNPASCSARCFDYTINVTPDPFQWPQDGSDVTVNVRVNKSGACSSSYSCEIVGGDSIPNATNEIDVTIGQGVSNISVRCSNGTDDLDKSQGVNGYCIARSCSAQGTCQGAPQGAASAAECSSSCNSNADCSTGRLIEPRP